jgi:predicted TIM-barrel fold metal-dependent hydrolase
MAYAGDRRIHDADSHVMETPGWLSSYADPDIRDLLTEMDLNGTAPGENDRIERTRADHHDPAYRSEDASQILLRKNWAATGSFLPQDRPAALDLLGFASQLVFNTFASAALVRAEQKGDHDVTYGMARAHNRAMADFCSVDDRLLPVLYTPLADFERSAAMTAEAVAMGAAAVMIPHACPPGHSPSHLGLEPVYAACAEAGVPIVLHVGGGGQLMDPSYFVNGRLS